MSTMPTYDQLHRALGQDWHIHDGGGQTVPVHILHVQAGHALSAQHSAFHLTLQLPMGAHAGQGTYKLVAPEGNAWPILMSPAAPSATGQACLQAAFHHPMAGSTAGASAHAA